VTRTDWLESSHSFSFGAHYDPDNLGFGPLIAVNVDTVQSGPGYPEHRHAGVEILTWVLAGELAHLAPGGVTRVRPGQLQYLSAGTGVSHTERSASVTEPVRVVQQWLSGSAVDDPAYAVEEIPSGPLVLAASAHRPAPIRLRHVEAELYLGQLPAGAELALPAGRILLLLLGGRASVDGVSLGVEDELRGPSGGERLYAETGSQLLVWRL